MENRILTIKYINYVSKWVEFWFSEKPKLEFSSDYGFERLVPGFDMSARISTLDKIVDKASLNEHVVNYGHINLVTTWNWISPNWKLIGISKD